jgi:hypothetical protein
MNLTGSLSTADPNAALYFLQMSKIWIQPIEDFNKFFREVPGFTHGILSDCSFAYNTELSNG